MLFTILINNILLNIYEHRLWKQTDCQSERICCRCVSVLLSKGDLFQIRARMTVCHTISPKRDRERDTAGATFENRPWTKFHLTRKPISGTQMSRQSYFYSQWHDSGLCRNCGWVNNILTKIFISLTLLLYLIN